MGMARYDTKDMRVRQCRANRGLLRTKIVDNFSDAARDTIAGLVFLFNRNLAPRRIGSRVGYSLVKRIAVPSSFHPWFLLEARLRVGVGLSFLDLTDKDDKGYCCLKAPRFNILVSTNVNVHAVGGILGSGTVSFSGVITILVARSRTSRVGAMNYLKRGRYVPICAARTIRQKVDGDHCIRRALIDSHGIVRGRIPFVVHSFHVATFRIPRSDASGINCCVRCKSRGFALTASINRVARAMDGCVNVTGRLVVRTGCSRRVLRFNACPTFLGRHMTDPAKRLDGHRTTRFLTARCSPGLGSV